MKGYVKTPYGWRKTVALRPLKKAEFSPEPLTQAYRAEMEQERWEQEHRYQVQYKDNPNNERS